MSRVGAWLARVVERGAHDVVDGNVPRVRAATQEPSASASLIAHREISSQSASIIAASASR